MAPQQPHGDRARCGARQMQLPHACLPRAAGRGGAPIRTRADAAAETGSSARRVRAAVARQGLACDRDDRPR